MVKSLVVDVIVENNWQKRSENKVKKKCLIVDLVN
jgi:hypothetical protein